MKAFYQEIAEQQFWNKWRELRKRYLFWGSVCMDVAVKRVASLKLTRVTHFTIIADNFHYQQNGERNN